MNEYLYILGGCIQDIEQSKKEGLFLYTLQKFNLPNPDYTQLISNYASNCSYVEQMERSSTFFTILEKLSALILENIVIRKHPYHEKKENNPEKTMVVGVTTSEFEGISNRYPSDQVLAITNKYYG